VDAAADAVTRADLLELLDQRHGVEALLSSSQGRVTGKVRVQLRPGSLFVLGVTSPHSLMAVSRGKYGEAAGEWSPADAYGFSKIMALPGMFHTRAGGQ